jgi:ribosomal protein S27AE
MATKFRVETIVNTILATQAGEDNSLSTPVYPTQEGDQPVGPSGKIGGSLRRGERFRRLGPVVTPPEEVCPQCGSKEGTVPANYYKDVGGHVRPTDRMCDKCGWTGPAQDFEVR